LQVGDNGGSFEDLEVNLKEGKKITLSDVEKNNAIATINKEENYLKVMYKYNLILQTGIRICINGDATPILKILVENKDKTIDACREQVMRAINNQVLSLTTTQVNDISQDIKDRVNAEVIQLTADKVFSILGNLNTDNPDQVEGPFILSQELGNSIPREYPIEASADISHWIRDSGYSPTDFVKTSDDAIKNPDRKTSPTPTDPTSPPEPPVGEEKITLNVGAAFKPGDYGVSNIQLAWGDAEQMMKWPNFAGVSLTSASKEDLKLKITYISGQTFGNYLPFSGKDRLIQPEDIGLIAVTLDGSEPEKRNAKEARGSVQYVPSGGGLKSTRNFYFPDKGKWRDSWYVASLAKNLAGTLNLEWTETTKKNKYEKHQLRTLTRECLTLE
jgi:hypothetical protein